MRVNGVFEAVELCCHELGSTHVCVCVSVWTASDDTLISADSNELKGFSLSLIGLRLVDRWFELFS